MVRRFPLAVYGHRRHCVRRWGRGDGRDGRDTDGGAGEGQGRNIGCDGKRGHEIAVDGGAESVVWVGMRAVVGWVGGVWRGG